MEEHTGNDKPQGLEGVSMERTREKGLPGRILVLLVVILLISIAFVMIARFNPRLPDEAALLYDAEVWPVKFQEPFDPASLSLWTLTDGVVEASISRMDMLDKRFEVVFAPTGQAIVRDAFYNERAVASGNFLLTMRINPPLSCHTGLVFKGSEQGDYYVFLVGNDSYTTKILQRENQQDLPREAILLNTPFPEGVRMPYTMNVLAYKNTYYFFINRIFLDKMRDDRLHGERTGIELMVCNGVTADSVFHLDDFSLKMPYQFANR